MRKKNKNKNLTIQVATFIFLLGTTLIFGQEDFTRDEYKLRQKYKISNSFFQKGRKYFLEGNYKKGEKELRNCLKKMPEHAEASFYLSLVFYNQGDTEKSLEYIEKAKENYKYIIKLKINREQMRILQLQDRKAELQETQQRIEQRLPKITGNTEASRREKSKLQGEMGRIEGMLGGIDAELRRPMPTVQKGEEIPADYFYRHGNVFFKLKRYQEAREQYHEAVKIEPKHGDAYNNLANLSYIDKQYQKALDYLNLAEKYGAKIHPEFKKAVLESLKKNLR